MSINVDEVLRLNFKVRRGLKIDWDKAIPKSRGSKILRACMKLYLDGRIKAPVDKYIEDNKHKKDLLT